MDKIMSMLIFYAKKRTAGAIAPAALMNWQLPTLPERLRPSTIGVKRLNFCVRYGYRWIPLAFATIFLTLPTHIVKDISGQIFE